MRPVFIFLLLTVAVLALPVSIDIKTHSLAKRRFDVVAELIRGAITFGVLVLGGGIVTHRAIRYYFDKKDEFEVDHQDLNKKKEPEQSFQTLQVIRGIVDAKNGVKPEKEHKKDRKYSRHRHSKHRHDPDYESESDYDSDRGSDSEYESDAD
jgi:hypothetical protein